MCVFNPAATLFQGKRLLLIRVAEKAIAERGCIASPVLDLEAGEVRIHQFRLDDPKLNYTDPRFFTYKHQIYLTSLSHFRVATSEDGQHFSIGAEPVLYPETAYETYGIEDARITQLEGRYYINYSAVSERGVVTVLAETADFKSFQRRGIIFAPDNKDCALFPEKINGRYQVLHRPAVVHAGQASIWTASSENLLDWGHHRFVAGPRSAHWDCERIGAGSPPIKTSQGWLTFYHGCNHQSRYCLGLLLLDLEKPWQVIRRSRQPFFSPEASYECEGFMPEVVFHNGTIDLGQGQLEIYYGATDRVTCAARVSLDDLLASLES
ncbi:glycoside hydrolase family 130 protein [Coraliomargarita algicola]|uniref:Glycoside hydrolase family 130 protein n=1 Tax=Coraliomargarita algicola TaxID=3092156 RepID=A0ABZ0RR89_9BACT|nr:glycoside hydrolase family 130 protein [Coraliomargarita sp. J2-16]WPJ97613.1 glycoside hydrolase family 130 protein [Coraliomargarita sp. J2-16]